MSTPAAAEARPAAPIPGPPAQSGLLALYDDEEAAAHAVAALRLEGAGPVTAYSPVPPHEILEEMEERPSVVRAVPIRGIARVGVAQEVQLDRVVRHGWAGTPRGCAWRAG